ncbi:MAG: TrbM/KikA/MpfK family conjugal transfer protein [Burkholderiaceae bacterium]
MNKKINFLYVAALVAAMLSSSSVAFAAGEVLTGDTKLACEAILCLSSGTRPNECQPSLARYFGISHRKWSDTVNDRRNFLRRCPTANDTSSTNMPAVVENIVNGAGRCDANYLNANNSLVVQKKICPNSGWVSGGENSDGCYYRDVEVVNNAKPAFCSAYANDQYTYLLGVKYVGDPLDGGHWVDVAAGK